MKEIYQEITHNYLEMLEKGTVPWRQPWKKLRPINYSSEREYQGINRLNLSNAPFESNQWLTFNQANRLGGRVRSGEKGRLVVYHKILDVTKSSKESADIETKKVPLFRYSYVFNSEQTEGLPKVAIDPSKNFQAITDADKIVQDFKVCPIEHNQIAVAAYSPDKDKIIMPPRSSFETSEDYYHTLFHEMVHSTGHSSRLNRLEGSTFGSPGYTKEELTAEIGAAFLSNEAGIIEKIKFEQSADYLKGWMKRLSEDPKLIVQAASHAEKAVAMVRNLEISKEGLSQLENSEGVKVSDLPKASEQVLHARKMVMNAFNKEANSQNISLRYK